jgi:hypothetical protein
LRIGGVLRVQPAPKPGQPPGVAYRLEADSLK